MRTDTERLNFLLQIMESEDEDAAERIQGAFMLGLKGRTALDAAMGAKLVEPGEPMPELTAIDLAVAELGRIRNVKGFSEEMDDALLGGPLCGGAVAYLLSDEGRPEYAPSFWPDSLAAPFKPSPDDPKRELTKGIALALCELDRLIRAERRAEIEAYLDSPEHRASIDALCEPEDVHVVKPAYNVRVDVFRPIEIGVPHEFKVGDQVRVLSNAHGNRFGYAPIMDLLVGQTYPISEVLPQTEYAPIGYRVGGWVFPAEQLERVDG